MKYLFCLLLCFPILQSLGRCGSEMIHVWPEAPSIQENPIIIIQGYARSMEIVDGLNQKYPIYLQYSSGKVELEIIEKCRGDMRLSQVLLKPKQALIPGETYTLIFENIPKKDHFFDPTKRWNNWMEMDEPYRWTCTEKRDESCPTWEKPPQKPTEDVQFYGCGPARYLVFDCQIEDSSEVLVHTTVRHIETGVEKSYFLSTDMKQIRVGHGMCAGAFTFSEGGQYEISFSLMDLAGNYNDQLTRTFLVEAPLG